jgi:hypothetical protein
MLVLSAHTQFGPDGRRADRLRDHHGIHPGQIVHRASEPSPSNRWGAVLANNSPGQTSRPNDGITDTPKEWQRSHAPRDAPEPDSLCKEQSRPLSQPLNGVITQPRTPCLSHVIKPNSGHSAIQLVLPSEALNQWERLSSFLTKRLTRKPITRSFFNLAANTTGPPGPHWWAREDLNLRPHAYQACALTS